MSLDLYSVNSVIRNKTHLERVQNNNMVWNMVMSGINIKKILPMIKRVIMAYKQ